jgi:hypothetical protein
MPSTGRNSLPFLNAPSPAAHSETFFSASVAAFNVPTLFTNPCAIPSHTRLN